METSILKKLGKKIHTVVDRQLLKHGTVLDVRHWPLSPMIEIDLHLPDAEMQFWMEVPYIKFSVGKFSFRDYTPFGWDIQTSTCSLLIDAAHQGPGSHWAAALQTGDPVHYLKIDSSRQMPHPTNLVVGLGDNSSMAHLMALQQLTLPGIRFEGVITSNDPQTAFLLNDYFPKPLLSHTSEAELMDWLTEQNYCNAHTSFYLTGNEQLVIRMQKLLKSLGHTSIRAKRFWS